jgi:hypothetical protein
MSIFGDSELRKRPLGMCFFAGDEGGDDGGGAGGDDGGDNSSLGQDFSIPEEYADRGWTKIFEGKSGDELKTEIFKSYDNSQVMMGKKVSEYLSSIDIKQLENFDDIKNVLLPQIAPEMQIPENAEGYALNDILKDENGDQAFEYPKEVLDHFSAEFHKAGLSKEQGQGLIKMYTDFEMEQFSKLTNADDLDKSLNAMFKNNTENKNMCSNLIKEFISDEDQKFLQDTAPNKTIELIYKIAKGFSENYDYKESGSPSQRGGHLHMSQAEKDKEYDKLYDQLQALNSRPHNQEEKDNIIKQMVALNK